MRVIRKEELPFVGSSYHFEGVAQDTPVSIYILEAQPGRGAPLHVHEYDEILINLEGRARAVVGEEVRETLAGEILVVKAHTPHGFINIGEGVLKQIDIHMSPRFAQVNLDPTEVSKGAGLPEPKRVAAD